MGVLYYETGLKCQIFNSLERLAAFLHGLAIVRVMHFLLALDPGLVRHAAFVGKGRLSSGRAALGCEFRYCLGCYVDSPGRVISQRVVWMWLSLVSSNVTLPNVPKEVLLT